MFTNSNIFTPNNQFIIYKYRNPRDVMMVELILVS